MDPPLGAMYRQRIGTILENLNPLQSIVFSSPRSGSSLLAPHSTIVPVGGEEGLIVQPVRLKQNPELFDDDPYSVPPNSYSLRGEGRVEGNLIAF